MKYKFYLSMLMLVLSITASAQIITLKGKVTDAKTGEAVPGASVLSGALGTSADCNGNFVLYVQQSVIEDAGVTVRSIGYQTIHLTNITDNYNVSLTPIAQELNTVNISAGAESIVQKAYRKIRGNYLNKSFNIIGVQRMTHSIRDTFGYQYYYTNNAKIKFYMSPYADTPAITQVGLIEKDEKSIRNPNALRIPFLDSYSVALTHDYVHRGSGILKGDPTKFRYKLNRKELIDGRKVYVVNFFSKFKEGDAGILYIDTATCAFVKILFTIYNVKSPKAIDLNKVTVLVQYKNHDDKWALDAVKYNSVTDFKGYNVERTEEFQVGMLITEDAAQLPAKAIIPNRAIDNYVKPYNGFTAADKEIPKDIQKLIKKSFLIGKIPKIADQVHDIANSSMVTP